MRARKIRSGVYRYRGVLVMKNDFYRKVFWEIVSPNGEVEGHTYKTLRDAKEQIDTRKN